MQGETQDITISATGCISGTITLDNSKNNNEGFVVSAASTSFMAVTGKDGKFLISDVPADTAYDIVIMKGFYTYLWKTNIKVKPLEEKDLGEHNILSSELNNSSIVATDVKYPIYYELNNGSLPENAPVVHTYGETTILVEPELPGYTFAGYYLTEDCSGEPVTTLGKDYVLGQKIYAKWILESMYDLFCLDESTTIELSGRLTEEYIDNLCYILQKIYERNPAIEITLDFSNVTEINNRYIIELLYTDIQNFDECNNIVKIIASNTLLKDNKYSTLFKGCKSIKEVVVNEGVQSIPDGAFSGCKWLVDIAIPESVTRFGNSAFAGCSSLTSFEITERITSFGNHAFSGCTGITTISIPNTITEISDSAFSGCTALNDVTIPDSVTSIGESAFSYCSALEELLIPEHVTTIGNSAFSNCTNLSNVTIPEGVRIISEYLFAVCSSLEEIIIPETVEFISTGAFLRCTALTSIIIPDGVAEVNVGTFTGCTNLESVRLPDSIKFIYEKAFYCCSNISLELPDSVRCIGEYAFAGCTGMTEIALPDSYETGCYIDSYAFLDSGLTSVTIPKSVYYIRPYAFSGCTNLVHVEIERLYNLIDINSHELITCAVNGYHSPEELADMLVNTYSYCYWEK
jgi:hypothetical protein